MLSLEIPSTTVELLNIDYTPNHWPSPGAFRYLGCHVKKPWEGGTAWKGYADLLQQFNNIKEILKPYEEEWVECDCIAALIPGAWDDQFSVMINGVFVCETELKLKKLRKLNGIKTPITTCNAKINGGGYLFDGGHRSYNIMLDLPRDEAEFYKSQRSNEKKALYKRFRYKVIEDHYKNKFFEMFDHRCFKCGATCKLEIDHHLPIILGGHLVPGNLVALCKTCNSNKLDKHPNAFYSETELKTLEPLLESQKRLFEFEFDWDYWMRDHEGYLVSLGISSDLVRELLTDPNHIYHIDLTTNGRLDITITVDLNKDW